MDAQRFDALTRALWISGPRRALAAFIASLLGLLVLAPGTADEADAKGRRKRRKKRHKHGKGRRKRNRKGKKTRKCRAKSRARICANRCGIVKNKKTCKKKVNCGSCACDATTCSGCCAGDGSCQSGTEDGVCGVAGETCQACEAEQLCADGVCRLCLIGSCEPGSTSGCQYATLQEAIDDPTGPAILELCARTYPGPIAITRELTLAGAGAGQTSLSGPESARVLTVPESINVTLQDLTITGGAGGISNAGTLTLHDMVVRGNTVEGSGAGGGGIANTGTLTLEDGSRIAGNTGFNGGGIHNSLGGVVILAAGSLVGGNTPADANKGTNRGGGIANGQNSSVTLQNGSQVAGNDGNALGGGITNDGQLTLESGSLVGGDTPEEGNTAGQGGGILTTFSGTTVLEAGSQVSNNEATVNGGGIMSFDGTVTVDPNAFVCDNLPTTSQCSAVPPPPIANCPSPPGGVCPPA